MSNVIIGIMAVILLIGGALASAAYLGPVVVQAKSNAQVAGAMGQQQQLAKAIADYRNSGATVVADGTVNVLSAMESSGTLHAIPPGAGTQWALNAADSALLMQATGTPAVALTLCQQARQAAGIPNPTVVLKCDGSTGTLQQNDPCCEG